MTAYDDLTAAVDLTVKRARYLSKGREKIIRDAALVLRGPVVEPPPPVDPPPPLPPQNNDPVTFFKVPINAGFQLCMSTWYKGWERYDRYIPRLVMEAGKSYDISLFATNRTTGGTALRLPGFEYAMLLNGVEVGRVRPGTAATQNVVFKLVTDKLPEALADGSMQYGLKQYDENGNEVPLIGSFVPSFIYLNRQGKLKDAPWFPAYDGSFEVFRNGFVFHWAIIPRHYIFNDDGTWKEPYAAPLVDEGTPQEWTAMLPSTEFTAVQLNPYLKDDHYIMTQDRFGAPAFEGKHVYDMQGADTESPDWVHPSVDGPRGVGRVIAPMDAQPSRLFGSHFLDHSSVGHCHASGLVQRHFGWVQDWPALQWQERAAIKARRRLIGNWDAVPEAKRGIDRSWTWYWDPRTVKPGTGAPIPNDGRSGLLEVPHDLGPTMLVPRPQPAHNDLLEAVYDPRSHLTPPKLRIGIEGLRSPWGVTVTDAGIVLITEQDANVVSVYQRSPDGTYTKLREVAGINHPQGIDHDGQGNVYVGSLDQRCLFRFDMATWTPVLFKPVAWTAKSFFVSAHVNKDPETGGTYICASSSNEAANFGNPETWLPDGTRVNPFPCGFIHGLNGGESATYAMPARTGWRIMVRGGSDIGLIKWRRKRTGDTDWSQVGRWDAAGFHRQTDEDAAKWCAEGFHLVYGRRCHPSFRIELPNGFADWADRYIKACRWGEA